MVTEWVVTGSAGSKVRVPVDGRVILAGGGGAVGGLVVHRDRLAAAAGRGASRGPEPVGTAEAHLDLGDQAVPAPGSAAVVSATLIRAGSKSFCTTASPRPQVNRSTAPRTVSPAAVAVWPAERSATWGIQCCSGTPHRQGAARAPGSRSGRPSTGQVTTVLEAVPAGRTAGAAVWVSTTVQVFSGIGVWS